MEGAGLNLVAPRSVDRLERSIRTEFKSLGGAAARVEIAPGIELHRALWTHGNALHSRRAYAGIRALAHDWPGGHAPQGFLTLFAPTFKGTTVFAAGCEPISIANRVQSPAVRGNPIKGPYLVIIVVGEYPEAHGYAPLRAYAQPIYSGNRFVPIDSETERPVLRALLESQRLFDREGIDIAIKKPVFDTLTSLGPCRPDFLLEARSRITGEVFELIVEAIDAGQGNEGPTAPASRRALETVAPIVDISPSVVEKGLVHRTLSDALFASRASRPRQRCSK